MYTRLESRPCLRKLLVHESTKACLSRLRARYRRRAREWAEFGFSPASYSEHEKYRREKSRSAVFAHRSPSFVQCLFCRIALSIGRKNRFRLALTLVKKVWDGKFAGAHR